tara:strand:+ start:184 stop:528 length:345 start_codon:yes stop_codon:yes gene_type:complete
MKMKKHNSQPDSWTNQQWGEYLIFEASDAEFAEVQSDINLHSGIFSAEDRKWIKRLAEERKALNQKEMPDFSSMNAREMLVVLSSHNEAIRQAAMQYKDTGNLFLAQIIFNEWC